MRSLKLKKEQYLRRRKRSKKSFPIKDEMRLCIFKSTNHIEAQIIDDFNNKTIVSASSKEKEFSKKKLTKTELAALVGTSLSKELKEKKLIKFISIEMVLDITGELNPWPKRRGKVV